MSRSVTFFVKDSGAFEAGVAFSDRFGDEITDDNDIVNDIVAKSTGEASFTVKLTSEPTDEVTITLSAESDTKSACELLENTVDKYSSIKAFSADAGYKGTTVDFIKDTLKLDIHIPEKISDGFSVLPKRWIVEKTFAWLGTFRRLFKDVEISLYLFMNI